MSKLAISMALIPLLLGGCIFSPKKSRTPPIGGPPDYDDPTKPRSVLYNLVLSYAARDSNEYKLLFDEARYLGISIDQSQPLQVTTDSLRWGDEARHISALARATDVTKIDVDFGSPSTWLSSESPYVDDPPGSEYIIINAPKLTIYQLSDNALQVSGVDQYEFRFGRTVHAPGDTTWKIISWTEIRQRP